MNNEVLCFTSVCHLIIEDAVKRFDSINKGLTPLFAYNLTNNYKHT